MANSVLYRYRHSYPTIEYHKEILLYSGAENSQDWKFLLDYTKSPFVTL